MWKELLFLKAAEVLCLLEFSLEIISKILPSIQKNLVLVVAILGLPTIDLGFQWEEEATESRSHGQRSDLRF